MRAKEDLLATPELPVPVFLTGQAAQILGIEIWRLQKFLDSPDYNVKLSPYGRLGAGRGSRRIFRPNDLYRVGIANSLVEDGFAPWMVAEVMQTIEDVDLKEVVHGEILYSAVTLERKAGKPHVALIRSGKSPRFGTGNNVYYFLDLRDVITRIDREIDKQVHPSRA